MLVLDNVYLFSTLIISSICWAKCLHNILFYSGRNECRRFCHSVIFKTQVVNLPVWGHIKCTPSFSTYLVILPTCININLHAVEQWWLVSPPPSLHITYVSIYTVCKIHISYMHNLYPHLLPVHFMYIRFSKQKELTNWQLKIWNEGRINVGKPPNCNTRALTSITTGSK